MAADDKWYFTKEQLQNTPSRKCGLDADKELSYRQQAANFIQDMGQKLQVSQLCINTAIVYMHRFYMFHSFTHFPWNTIAAAAFFLAAKVEEQPRKLEHVIRIANHCLHREQPVVFDAKSEQYAAQSQDLVFNENVLLQTLGFDVAIDHPHTHVVRCCHLVRDFCALMHAKSLENVSLTSSALKVNDCISASIDLSKTSYFMASNSLHLTTMCLQYKPTVVACFCIHLASKWSNWQIPKSNEGKDWYYYVDKTVTAELLEQLTSEFLKIFDKCPSRLKRKISSISNHNSSHNIDQLHAAATSAGSPFDPDSRKYHSLDTKDCGGPIFHRSHHESSKQALLATPDSDPHKKTRPHDPQQRADYREYREKKERERLMERDKSAASSTSTSSSTHHKSGASASTSGGSVKHLPSTATTTTTTSSQQKQHHRPQATSASATAADPTKMKRPEHTSKEAQPPRDLTNGRERYIPQQQQQQQQSQSQSQQQQQSLGLISSDNKQKVTDTKLPPKYHPKYAHQKVPATTTAAPRDSVSSATSVINDKKVPTAAAAAAAASAVAAAATASSAQDNKQFLINKQINSTSQRHKSPFTEIKPSVPHHPQQQQQQQQPPATSTISRNGSDLVKPGWPPQQQDVEEIPVQPNKKSSLFSPEKTPPQQQQQKKYRTPPSSTRRLTETPQLPTTSIPPPISPFGSPPPIQSHPKLQTPTSLRRSRTSSSGSEPELRPVVKKLDQIIGFENIIRDSKMGIKLPKVPDIIQPICDRPATTIPEMISKELKPPDIIKPFPSAVESVAAAPTAANGIETDPVVISSLLKEVADDSVHHKSEKKKKKDKHKHKDKDKRDEKKKKHKDKDKRKTEEVPLKITISKKNVEPLVLESQSVATTGLKVKISRDKINSIHPADPPSALKIKISKDHIQYNSVVDHQMSNNGSRKRMSSSGPPPGVAPPKIPKQTFRQNGKNYYNNKVLQIGEGDSTHLRLAESKYQSKGASKTS